MKILFIEDDHNISKLAKDIFLGTCHDLIVCPGPDEAIKALKVDNFDLIILDMEFKSGSGEDVLFYMKNKKIFIPVFIQSGYTDRYNFIIEEYKKIGLITRVYQKPSTAAMDIVRDINCIR